MNRRDLMLTSLAGLLLPAAARSTDRPGTPLRGRRLKPGDTVGLIEPASATWDPFDIQLAEEALAKLGLRSKRAAHLLGRAGYFSGEAKDRATDVNVMFADPSVAAILAIRGGWGCARILPYLDYAAIRANPKILIGYSDITALHMAIQAKTGLVTLHGPVGVSAWGERSVTSFKQVAFDGAMPLYENPVATDDRLVQKKWRTQTITPGIARGKLIGGNLTVLSALVGTPYVPDFSGAILFLEDIGEAEYRIDRMITQLALGGLLKNLAGVVFGQCTECIDKDRNFGGYTLSDILNQHFAPLGVPAYQGAFIGHMPDQFTIPVGIRAEMNATTGTVKLLEPAVV